MFTAFCAICGSPKEPTTRKMRTPHDRRKFFDRILNDSEEARFWAENCSWEPGTGYCRNQRAPDCNTRCTFRHLRLAEADQIRRNRQQRRPTQQ